CRPSRWSCWGAPWPAPPTRSSPADSPRGSPGSRRSWSPPRSARSAAGRSSPRRRGSWSRSATSWSAWWSTGRCGGPWRRERGAGGAGDEVGELGGGRVGAQARAARGQASLGAARALTLALGGWLPLLAIVGLAPWLLGHGVTAGTLLGMLAYIRGGLQPALSTMVHGVGGSGTRLTVTLERILEASRPPTGAPAAAVAGGGRGLRPRCHSVELRGV